MKYIVPHGHIMVRPDAPEEQRRAIHLGVAEKNPWGTVLQAGKPNDGEIEVLAGDRVRFRKHTDEEVFVQLPTAPDVVRCSHCGVREDEPDRLENCAVNRDVRTNAPLDHDFVNVGPEPETLSVVAVANVLLVARS